MRAWPASTRSAIISCVATGTIVGTLTARVALLAAHALAIWAILGGRPATAETSRVDLDLVDLAIIDKSIRLDARYATKANFTGEVLPGYVPGRVLLRRDAALALARVEARLRRENHCLVVLDGYRPVEASAAMVRWAKVTGREDLLVDGYIAARSRHNQGIAVDVTLMDGGTGKVVDMGSAFDEFSAASHTDNATGKAREHRARLVEAMRAEGFENYAKEWWHFTYVGKVSPAPKPQSR